MRSRDDIPAYLESLDLVGEAVEVGVCLGHYSETLLAGTQNITRLWSVDTWDEKYPGLPGGYSGHRTFVETSERLWRFGHRSVMTRLPSVEAAGYFRDRSLVLVYIDGNHTYEAVSSDIQAWAPKVRPGGILAGHDYNDVDVSPEVRRAVDEFCARQGVGLMITTCDFMFPINGEQRPIRSWITRRPPVE